MTMQATPQTLVVLHSADVPAARRIAKAVAEAVGFDPKSSEEVALAVSELASNLVKHASGGVLRLIPLAEGGRHGIEVESLDSGPGIADVEQALTDGFSTAGSLGYGLGAVNRLLDQLEVSSQRGRGTRVVGRRWLRPAHSPLTPCPLAFGAATRAYPGMAENGDAFVIQRWEDGALVGVIDGLGHGRFACRAAQTARHYLEAHFDQPLPDLFRGVERACRATRGVVMSLARFDWRKGTMAFAGVGNVEARILRSAEPLGLVVQRGVLGSNAPRPLVTEHAWQPAYLLLVYSDGIRSRWQWADVCDLADEPAPALAAALVRRLAREDDDATVVVVRDEVS